MTGIKSILVTGGCGFIGTSLIKYLLKEKLNIKIRVLDNLSVGSKEDLLEVCSFAERKISEINGSPSGSSVELVVGDIKNPEDCLRSCGGIDAIVHLAANTGVAPSVENPRQDMEANVIGTFNMLEAARLKKVKRFVFASSGAPVGEVEPPVHEEKAPKPASPYGAGKLSGEGYCSAYSRTFGLKTVSLRFSNVYGPRSKHKQSVVAKFIKQAIQGENLLIYGDGNQTRDFIYIDDLLQAIMLSLKSDTGGEVFQIATYKETTVNEIASKIRDIVKGEMGKGITIVHEGPRPGDVRRNYADISKARALLGYEPEFDLDRGLQNTFEYFKSQRTG